MKRKRLNTEEMIERKSGRGVLHLVTVMIVGDPAVLSGTESIGVDRLMTETDVRKHSREEVLLAMTIVTTGHVQIGV